VETGDDVATNRLEGGYFKPIGAHPIRQSHSRFGGGHNPTISVVTRSCEQHAFVFYIRARAGLAGRPHRI
jgi:hypothetical protein